MLRNLDTIYDIARSSKNFSTGINFSENIFLVYRGRLRWRLTGRPFPSGHPRTLRRVLDPGPDQLRDNISLVRARGGHGTVLLELACSRMLRGEKLMSRELFAGRKGKGKNKTCKFLPCHYLNSKTLVGGKG